MSSSQPSTGLSTLTIASIDILRHNKYILMYNTLYFSSQMVPN